MVSSSESMPWSTSASATAPLNAFEVLAMRMWSVLRIGVRPRLSPTPARCTVRLCPCWTTEMAPAGPPGMATSLTMAWSSCCAALVAASAVPASASTATSVARPARSTARCYPEGRVMSAAMASALGGGEGAARPASATASASRRTPSRIAGSGSVA